MSTIEYPVQFVEGFNEEEEPFSERFLTWPDCGVAIPYTPAMTYNLARIEIYGTPLSIPETREQVVKVFTDYRDKPGKTCLVTGKVKVPTSGGEQWLSIDLEESRAVFANRKYWLAIEDCPLFTIGLAKDGEALGLRNLRGGKWAAGSFGRHRCMLRYFGSIIPVIGQPGAGDSEMLAGIEKHLTELEDMIKGLRLPVRSAANTIEKNWEEEVGKI